MGADTQRALALGEELRAATEALQGEPPRALAAEEELRHQAEELSSRLGEMKASADTEHLTKKVAELEKAQASEKKEFKKESKQEQQVDAMAKELADSKAAAEVLQKALSDLSSK